MKLLITGSGGFVGNFLAKYFSEKGVSVAGIDLKHHDFQNYDNFTPYDCDITSSKDVSRVFNKEKPTHVIHLAYIMDPIHNRELENRVDYDGSVNVFESAKEVGSVKQLIFFSSPRIYGGRLCNPLWINERQPFNPEDELYALNKVKVEDYYNQKKSGTDIKVVILRMCSACGPSYFKKGGVVNILLRAPVFPLINGTDIYIQLIHEDDVKKIIEMIINDNEVEGVFHMAPPSYATQRELSPNPKLFLPVPKWFIANVIKLLWKLRLGNVSPGYVNLISHSLVVSPYKLMKRYNYKFQYSTKDAFYNTVNKDIKK